MSIQLVCVKGGTTFDVTNTITRISWSGHYKSCSRKLEFSMLYNTIDVNAPKFDIPLSSLVVFYEDGKELFRGFVWERQISSSGDTINYLCYDYAEKLNKIKVSYNIKNKTAQDVMRKALKDYGFKECINIAGDSTKISKLFVNVSIYDMIMTAYTEQGRKSGKKYMVYAEKDTIGSRLKGHYVLQVNFEEQKNIFNNTFKESISNMVNKVILVDDKGNKQSEVTDDVLLKVHGLFQEVYTLQEGKDGTTEAKGILHGVDQTCTLEGFGDSTCITGFAVKVYDKHTKMSGLFYIDADSHTWEKGNHIISLDLAFKNMMDEKDTGAMAGDTNPTTGETPSNSNSSSTGTPSGNNISSSSTGNKADKLVSLAQSKLGCKYVWGATGPNQFDCSGFTQWLHKQVGVGIPRNSASQGHNGYFVARHNLKAGDLVFFITRGTDISHVGLYVGDGKMIHASNPSSGVRYDSIDNEYYKRRFTCGRRYI